MSKKPSQTGRLLKSIFNPKAWMDYEQVKNSTNYLTNGISKMFTLQEKVQNIETFDETIARLNMDEDQLLKQKKSLFRLAILMIFLSAFVFIYAMYLIYSGSFHAAGASLVVFLVLLSLSFRYHFWYYQLSVRRLGCGLREWFMYGLLGTEK